MKYPLITFAILFAIITALFAQEEIPAISVAAAISEQPDSLVTLPAFSITESPSNPYISRQALSASRVAMSIQDIPQTVSVVTSEFIQDTQGFRLLDAAKYVTPVVESTLPFGGDRYTIRGFQVSHEFVDGAEISGQDGYSMSLAPYNIERIEIIKGPNAILVPGGSPGGQMNPITKSPLMKEQASLTLELSRYFSDALSADINRVLSSKHGVATRFIAAYWDADGYARNQFRRGYLFAPSISWQLSAAHQAIIKAEFMHNRETNLNGLPIDPAIGSTQHARIARGLPRNWSFAADNEFDRRFRATERITFELLSKLGSRLSSRLQLMANHVVREDQGGTGAAIASAGGGSRNPYTGLYEPGVNWNTASWAADTTGSVALVGTAVPVTSPDTWVFTRNQNAVDLYYSEGHFRNDYALQLSGSRWKSTTVAGASANFSQVQFKSYTPQSRPSIPASDLGNATYPDLHYPQPTATNLGGNRTGRQKDLQIFVYESLSLWGDMVQISGGASRFLGELDRTDSTGIPPANLYPHYSMSTTAKTFGAVLRAWQPLSLFYGYNSSGGTMPSSLNPGTYPKDFRAAEGEQNEIGLKLVLPDDSLTASFSYFEIAQQNYAVANSEYYNLVSQGRFAEAEQLEDPLYLDLNSKGWEFEFTYSLSQSLTLIGNYTKFKIRQPITNVRVRGVPDQSAALFIDYRFTRGPLRGLGLNLGVDYKDEVAGDNVTGYTSTRPLPSGPEFVANQPSFMVAGRSLVNLGLSYRRAHWTARLQVSNLLDKDYILAAGSRTALMAADPLHLKGSISYRF